MIRTTDPTVSIIIPLYNAGNLLYDAMESVLAQDYDPRKMEVIMINDGSTDDTLQVAQTLLKNNKGLDLQLHSGNQNRGAAYSRNQGVKKSRGEYLFFFDGDDLLHEECISACMNLFERGAGFVYTDHASMDAIGTMETRDRHLRYEKRKKPFDLREFLETGENHVGHIRSVRKNEFVPYRTDLPYAEDTAWFLDIALAGTTFGHVPRVLYYWRNEVGTLKWRGGEGSMTDRISEPERDAAHRSVMEEARRRYELMK